MPREFSRSRRVADQLQRELARMIQRSFQDSDFGLITISMIKVSPDLRNADIFFTCLDNKVDIDSVQQILNQNAGQFRHELSRCLPLRHTPRLHFEFDSSLDQANRLTNLIDSLHSQTREQDS